MTFRTRGHPNYDRLWVNLSGIDGGLWTMLVWISGGDLCTTASFTQNDIDSMALSEIETRQKCVEILTFILKARLLDMKEKDAKMRATYDQIDPFTVKMMRNIRMSHSDIIFPWWVRLDHLIMPRHFTRLAKLNEEKKRLRNSQHRTKCANLHMDNVIPISWRLHFLFEINKM